MLGCAFGVKVGYDANTKIASYEFEGKTLSISAGNNKVTIIDSNGNKTTTAIDPANASVTPINVNNRLYVPAILLKNLGFETGWVTATKSVSICYPKCNP